jgi:hypothetical protein
VANKEIHKCLLGLQQPETSNYYELCRKHKNPYRHLNIAYSARTAHSLLAESYDLVAKNKNKQTKA